MVYLFTGRDANVKYAWQYSCIMTSIQHASIWTCKRLSARADDASLEQGCMIQVFYFFSDRLWQTLNAI